MPPRTDLPPLRDLTVEEFVAYTGWQTPYSPAAMRTALDYYQRNIPHAVLREPVNDPSPWALPRGGVVRLCELMQAIDFGRPVSIARIRRDEQLKAFHTRRTPRRGRWYTLLSTRQDTLAIPRNQVTPHVFVAASDFECLSSTVADAYVDWARNLADAQDRAAPEYRHGGGRQFFVADPARCLRPL